MIVKICGITRRQDAEAAVEAGASALGFVFATASPRYIKPNQAFEVGRGLAAWKVGIFVDETEDSIKRVMEAARLDIAQVYGSEAPWRSRVWRAFRVNGRPEDVQHYSCEAVLLDGLSSGSSFDWNLARGAANKVIVAGGLNPSNVAEAIRAARPWGVDASSSLESSPGIKDHEKIRRFVGTALNLC